MLRAREGQITDPTVRAQVEPMLKEVAALPHVTGVVSPYSPAGAHAVSTDGQIAFATVNFDKRANVLPKASIENVISTAERARSKQLEVQLGGQAIEQAQKPALGTATAVGLLAAMIILFITFGSLLAMGLPIVTALLGLGTGIGLAGLASQVIGVPSFAIELAAMIGLGVGIDYALFIVTRFRENFRAGAELQSAIDDAMDSAGRAVLFAGVTVIIALLGQFLLGVSFLYGLAVASALAVLMTMLAALTVLPAALSRLGARIGRPSRRERANARRARCRAARLLGLVGQRDPTPPLARCARGTGDHARAGGSRARAAIGQQRRGQQPAQRHHPPGLRPDRQGLRTRLQRPAARSSRASPTPATARPWRASRAR